MVFGESLVHANQHYDGAEGHGEVDCLVTGGTPVVIEVKSRSVTDQGRRGSRDHLERVAKGLLERSFDQTRRAADYIKNGGRRFSSREGREGRLVLHEKVVDPLQVVVSFEGIDLLAISVAGLIESESDPSVWLTDLADFLLVRDVLSDPASFLHYAQIRSDRSRSVPYIESDALVGYLEGRLQPTLDREPAHGADAPLLSFNSGRVNDYYTKMEMGFPTEMPGLGVPDEVREALKVTGLQANSTEWWETASAIMDMNHADWTRWKHFHRRDRTDRVFTSPARTVDIVLSSNATEAEIITSDRPMLVVPTISVRERPSR